MAKTGVKQSSVRARSLTGGVVAKDLLILLRKLRSSTAGQRSGNGEEIEMWEDLIREHIQSRRAVPASVLELDRETVVALDEVCLPNRSRRVTDEGREYRRRFALRAIKSVCAAWVMGDARFYDFAVTGLRDITEEELRVESLIERNGAGE